MKKMTPRDQVLLVILSVVAVLALLFRFAYTPLQKQKFTLKEEMNTLSTETKNITELNAQLATLQTESSKLSNQINEMDAQKGFGVMNYQELLTYLGESAKEYGVDITSFQRMKFENKINYWEVPFELTVQGDYQDIILFVDSVYQLNEYFAIRQLNLQLIDMIPMTPSENTEGQTSDFSWGPAFIQRLNENVPSNFAPSKGESNEEEGSGSESGSDYTKYLDALNQTSIEKKVQLTFSFHFISLEETPEDLKE